MHTEVQEQCKQHMPTRGATHSAGRRAGSRWWEGRGRGGRGGEGLRVPR